MRLRMSRLEEAHQIQRRMVRSQEKVQERKDPNPNQRSHEVRKWLPRNQNLRPVTGSPSEQIRLSLQGSLNNQLLHHQSHRHLVNQVVKIQRRI